MIVIKKDIVVDEKDKKHNVSIYVQRNYDNERQQ